MESFEDYQDVIGQLPMLKTYLQFCLGFSIDNEQSEDLVVNHICKVALTLTEAFPWFAHKVVHRGYEKGNSGIFSMVPCPQFEKTFVRRVKDCKEIFPSYAEILKSDASLKILDGSVLAPRPAFPLSYEETEDDPAPVLALQVNFVQNGVLLNWACQHNVMDASGLSQVIQLFACAMRDQPLPSSAIDWGNRRRRDMIPLLGPNEPAFPHTHLRRPPVAKYPTSPAPFLAFEWSDFRFSAESLKDLKRLASNKADFVNPSVSYVSTNDALSAFCWQCIARARLQLGHDAGAVSKFARAVDVRSIMKVSPEYMGHMIYIATSFLPLESVATKPLAHVSSVLRQSLNEASNEHEVRSFATLIANTQDKSTIAFAGNFNPGLDIGSSSGLAMQWRLDYGPLGKPDFMNRPRFTPIPSTVYILPMRADGSVDVQLSLRPEELSIIKEDETWGRFARLYE